jgi:hypothetical protein
MIVFGSKVNPTIIGTSPNLPANATASDNIPMQYDFRQIYTTILTDWFGVNSATSTSILNGYTAPNLPIFKYAVGGENVTQQLTQLSLEQNFPNPVREHTVIRFTTSGGMVQILLYDEMGRMLRVLYENDVPAGTFEIGVDRNALPAGNYFYQIHVGHQKMTKKMVIVN